MSKHQEFCCGCIHDELLYDERFGYYYDYEECAECEHNQDDEFPSNYIKEQG